MPVSHDYFEGVKEVAVLRDSDEVLELRQIWTPHKPLLVFGVLMGVYTSAWLFFVGVPDSAEALAVMGGVLSLVGYATAAQCFNSTFMAVTGSELRWRHGPFPARRGGRIRAGEIAAVVYGKVRKTYSEEELERFRRDGERKRTSYAVGVLLRDGKGARRFFDGMFSEEAAATAAERIAARLGGVEVRRAEQEDLVQRTDTKIGMVILAVIVLLIVAVIIEWQT